MGNQVSRMLRADYIAFKISLLLLLTCSAVGYEPNANYSWRARSNYYFPDLLKKVELIAERSTCKSSIVVQKDFSVALPSSGEEIFISSFPVSKEMFSWWKNIPRPTQMRVDPYICHFADMSAKSVFSKMGCQQDKFYSPSAPRCQTEYLKWACEQSRIPINSSTPNHFILPESDHSLNIMDPPPQPWLLTARNAMVCMCGHLSLPCGTQSN